jgi:hypothetical protein
MSTPWFFLSYASIDTKIDQHVVEFFTDLVNEVRVSAQLKKNKVTDDDIGFCASDIPQGSEWSKVLTTKLGSCRVLVCLYSKAYFESEPCGKEFWLFRNKFESNNLPPNSQSQFCVIPVLWVTDKNFHEGDLPQSLRSIHYKYSGYAEAVDAGGVYYLKADSQDRSKYQNCLKTFVAGIKEAAERNHDLKTEISFDFEAAFNAFVDPPEAPTGLEAEFTASRKVELKWEDNSGGKGGFIVERLRTDSSAGFTRMRTLKPGTTTYTNATVTPDKTYRYRVCAVNSGGPSSWVESADVKVPLLKTPPPRDFSGEAISAHEIKLSWNSEATTTTKIERQLESATEAQRIAEVDAKTKEYLDSGLNPDTTYIYYVCASDSVDGDSRWVGVTVRTKPSPPPPPPWPVPPSYLVAAVLIVAISVLAFVFRCSISPGLCGPVPGPSPQVSPTPLPISAEFSDRFEQKPNSTSGWVNDVEWSYPVGVWSTEPGRDGDTVDRALIVKGDQPGFTKRAFGDFKVHFTISHLEGAIAGWFLRAQTSNGAISGYRFTLKKGTDNKLFLEATAEGSKSINISPGGCNVALLRYKEKTDDYIDVEFKVKQNTFDYSFRLKNPDPNDPRSNLPVGCEMFKDESGNFIDRGHIGFFANTGSAFKVEDLIVTKLE